MKFKVGDKVKFLNENGGGIVTKIVGPALVNVAIEDGFEIPVLANELIRIELDGPLDSPKHMFREEFHPEIQIQPESVHNENERFIPLLNNRSKGTLAEGIYFIFIPHDQKWLITGMLDVYLANHTPYDILYSVYLEKEKGGYEGFDYGSVASEAMVLLDTIDREDTGKWGKGNVQVLFHRDSDERVLAPGNSNFSVEGSRFYQEGNYKESSIINGRAIMLFLLPLSSVAIFSQSKHTGKENDEGHIVNEATIVKPENIIEKHKTGLHEAVVDLHIYELVEDHTGLDSSEILKIQVNYFSRCLENAIATNYKKVTFIHGVGTGVLKTAIKEIIKEYQNIEIRDASMQQFGYGATEMIIK